MTAGKTYSFGPFRLDLRSGELLRGGEAVRIEPRVFTLLTYLVEERGRLITREELLEKLWPGTHVSDASLSQAVAALREALGDQARSPQYITTLPRRGYKFIGVVVEAQPERTRPAEVFHVIFGLQDFILAPGETIIGRAGDAGVRIQSHNVSRHHARIVVSHSGATIEDLGSMNGTQVGGARLEGSRPLNDGDQIVIGDATLFFQISGGARTTATTPAEGRRT